MSKNKALKPLSNKQQAFVAFYLQFWNATEAAKAAGYKGDNSTLRAIGSENLTKPNIKSAISTVLAELQLDANEPLLFLYQVARGEAVNYLADGTKQVPTMAQRVDAAKHLAGVTARLDININLNVKAYTKISPDDWPEPRVIDVTPED